MRYAFALAVVLGSLLVACSGGGSAPPTVAASPATAQTSAKTGSATFAIFIPSATTMKRARPNYVSPNTAYAGITLTEVSGSPVPSPTPLVVNLTPSSPNCSASSNGTTCTVTATYLVGADAWTIALYGPNGVTSTPLSINSVSQTVVAGQNTVSLTMNPVVASLTFAPNGGSCQSNDTSCVQPGTLEALDATGAVIVGPGNFVNASQTPVTIDLSSAPSGVTYETSSGSAATASATGPAQMNLAQIAYNGSGSPGTVTIAASDTDGDSASYTLTLTAPPPSVPSWNGGIVSTNFSPTPVVNGTPDAFTPPYGDTSSGAGGTTGSTADNGEQTCETSMSNNYHVHVFIGIYVNGSWLALPEGLGIQGFATPPDPYITYATCFYFTHTHDSTDVFHLEYPNPNDVPVTQPVFYSGDLFNVWGITVSSSQFGPFSGPVTVFTSGQVYRGGGDCSGTYPPSGTVIGNDAVTPESDLTLWTGDPNEIPLYSHEVIWYYVGSGNPTSLPNVGWDLEC